MDKINKQTVANSCDLNSLLHVFFPAELHY